MSNPQIILHSPTGVIRILFDAASAVPNRNLPTRALPTHSQERSRAPREWIILTNSTSKDFTKSKRGVMELEPEIDQISNDQKNTTAGAAREGGGKVAVKSEVDGGARKVWRGWGWEFIPC